MFFIKNFKYLLIIFFTSTILVGCGSFKLPSKKAIEPNASKRAQQNVKDGVGVRIFKRNKSNNGNFLFASSNPLWKASLDTLSFISLANVDYSGGVIITDWYSEDDPNEAIKITVKFLSNEIRADGLIINLYKRNCVKDVCSTKEIKNKLVSEIRDKILKKAVIYKVQDDKIAKENRPKKVFKGDNEE